MAQPHAAERGWISPLPTTQRRVELLIALYDAIAAYGPISAYAAGQRLGMTAKHTCRYVRVLVREKLLTPCPLPNGKSRYRVRETDRRKAVTRIGEFGAKGIHTQRRTKLVRHVALAGLIAQRFLGTVFPSVDDYLNPWDDE